MKIEITEQDIKNGNPCDSEACAVSQALRRYFKTNAVYTSIREGGIILELMNNLVL